jgi:hypothetical protein
MDAHPLGSTARKGIGQISKSLAITFDAGRRELPILGATRRMTEAGVEPPLRMADILPTRALEDFEQWVHDEFADSDLDESTSSTYLKDLTIKLPKLGWAVVKGAWLDMPAFEDACDSCYQPIPFTLVCTDFRVERQGEEGGGKKVRSGLTIKVRPSTHGTLSLYRPTETSLSSLGYI